MNEQNVRFNGPWFVMRVDQQPHAALESHATEASAIKACRIVNDHAINVGSHCRYEVKFVAAANR